MTRVRREEWHLLLTLALFLALIGQGMWIYVQNERIEELERTEFDIVYGFTDETIFEIGRFMETRDRAVLENVSVRMEVLERQVFRARELAGDDEEWQYPTSPSRLIDLIIRHNIRYEQAIEYLIPVSSRLGEFQLVAAPAEETEQNRQIYIQIWRDLYELANETHEKWNLPESP